MATNIVNTDGENTPNYKTVRISSIDLPAEAADGSTVSMKRDIREQMKEPAPNTDKGGKTVLIKSILPTGASSPKSAGFEPLPPEQWIHGWLVAVSGPMKGRSFPIRYGNNTVGRSNTGTICLPDDDNISRSQFSIRYVQGKNIYVVTPINTASQITYLSNDEELLFPTAVCEGDMLKLSPKTTVRFVPFCDAQYKWDYTDLPPAPDLPQSTPVAPVTVPVDVPPAAMIDQLPPIPQEWANGAGNTIRVDTSEIGLDSNNQAVQFETQNIGTNANAGNADVANLNATVRLERAMQNRARQNAEEDHTHIFRPNAKGSAHHPAENWEQGWLVAISGPMKGMYFPITVGINQGGRSTECRICLPFDKGISGVQFAIRYIQSKKQFFVTCMETASQLTYLNGEELTNYELIERGDILQVSEQTCLRFIPLCNDSFCWDYPDNL